MKKTFGSSSHRKVVDSTPKYYLLAGDTSQAFIFLLALHTNG